MLNVTGCAPQVGWKIEEKEKFWSELDEVVESILKGHVGEGKRGGKEGIDEFGVKERNLEGQRLVELAKRVENVRNTQVNFFLRRQDHLKEIGDCQV